MDSKFFLNNVVMVNFNSMLEVMYKALYDYIKDNGGFINCQDNGHCDKIYSLEFVSGGEVAEWNVLAVMVENGNIYYCAEYQSMEEYSKEELMKMDWFDLKIDDHYYIQTMYNIAESISQYVKED